MRQALKRAIQSGEYQRAQRHGLEGVDETKVDILQKVISRHRRAARVKLEKESKDVRNAFREVAQRRRQAALGQSNPGGIFQ